jgi:hypothetical protein
LGCRVRKTGSRSRVTCSTARRLSWFGFEGAGVTVVQGRGGRAEVRGQFGSRAVGWLGFRGRGRRGGVAVGTLLCHSHRSAACGAGGTVGAGTVGEGAAASRTGSQCATNEGSSCGAAHWLGRCLTEGCCSAAAVLALLLLCVLHYCCAVLHYCCAVLCCLLTVRNVWPCFGAERGSMCVRSAALWGWASVLESWRNPGPGCRGCLGLSVLSCPVSGVGLIDPLG